MSLTRTNWEEITFAMISIYIPRCFHTHDDQIFHAETKLTTILFHFHGRCKWETENEIDFVENIKSNIVVEDLLMR